tara:strand:+ start:19182 stop:19535 length:354 start_codon:yes stop_codon:yes gene_type:complete
MISLIVDESYAYDYLSILKVKAFKKDSEETISNFMDCSYIIKMQVGSKLHSEILSSKEYEDLLNINKETFDAVDKAKKDKVKASYVDELNYERFLCKSKLQKKFFKLEQTENKIGYS